MRPASPSAAVTGTFTSSRPCRSAPAHAPRGIESPGPCQHARLLRNSPATLANASGATRASRSRRRGLDSAARSRPGGARGGGPLEEPHRVPPIPPGVALARARASVDSLHDSVSDAHRGGGPQGAGLAARPGDDPDPDDTRAQPWAQPVHAGARREPATAKLSYQRIGEVGDVRRPVGDRRPAWNAESPRPPVRGDHRRSVVLVPEFLDRQTRAGRP